MLLETRLSRRKLAANVTAMTLVAWGVTHTRQAHAALAMPSDKVLLTVSGKIGIKNVGDTAQFDRAMLEGLGMHTIKTHTKWDNDVVTFEGPLMSDVMKAVGASGVTAQAIALNDYHTDIPIEDFARYNPILSMKRDGNYMSVREKGPLFVVYPYDSDTELNQQKYYGRSAWQVAQFVIK